MDPASLLSPPLAAILSLLLSTAGGPGPREESAPPPTTSARAAAATASPAPRPVSSVPVRKTWTAADLTRLSGRGVSVSGSQDEQPAEPALQQEEGSILEEGSVLAQATSPAVDWAGRAAASRAIITAGETRMATIDEIRDQWGAFVLATGQYEAVAAHELGKLREEQRQWDDAVNRARAELLALEEAARKSGVEPGQLR